MRRSEGGKWGGALLALILLPAPALAESDACRDAREVLETTAEKLDAWGASTRRDHMAVLRIGTRAATAAAWAVDLGWPAEAAAALAALRDLKGSDQPTDVLRATLIENAVILRGSLPGPCPDSALPDFAAYGN